MQRALGQWRVVTFGMRVLLLYYTNAVFMVVETPRNKEESNQLKPPACQVVILSSYSIINEFYK